MKLFAKIFLLILLPAFLYAQPQQEQLDKLRLALKNASDDTIRMDIDEQLGLFYAEINRDSALFYFEKEVIIAEQLKLMINEASALDYKGYILYQLRDYPESLQSLMQAIKIAENPASEKNTWHLPNGQIPQTFRLSVLASIHHDLGHLYGKTGNIDKQISNYLETRRLAESLHDTVSLGFVNWNLGSAYWNLNKLDSALFLEQKALAIFSNSNNKKYEGAVLDLIGNIYLKKGNINLSGEALLKSEQINEEQNNFSFLGDTYISLGNLYQTAKRPGLSLVYAKKALKTYTEVGKTEGIVSAYSLLASVYSQLNKTDSAFTYLKLASTAKDSQNDVERKNLLAFQNVGFNEQMHVQKLEEDSIQTQNKIRTYAMLAGIVVFMLIAFLLYRNNRNRKKANESLQKQKEEIEVQKKNVEETLMELKSTQAQLIQSEKMASLGELTAGIAHEIQNPLNFVNNFSEVNKEMLEELKAERLKPKAERDEQTEDEIIEDVIANEEKINHHGKRADAIVKGMLQHSRKDSGQREPTDINALCDEYLRLSYHGLRAKDKEFNATMKTEFDANIVNINIIPQDIGRVLLNLFNNAFYTVSKRQKAEGEGFKPLVSVQTKKINDKIEIIVKDNGNGIPQNIIDKIFQPFFTTKPTGEGTGLGLSLSYDIIKAHGGEIKVETKDGEGSEFIIQLPIG